MAVLSSVQNFQLTYTLNTTTTTVTPSTDTVEAVLQSNTAVNGSNYRTIDANNFSSQRIDPTGFSTAPFLPLGLPEFIANAIWSAFWAVLMAWLLRVAPQRRAPWVPAFVFGGVVLTAASVFVVDPLRGIWPSGNMLPRLAVGFAANAMWGWGALVFMRAFMASEEEE